MIIDKYQSCENTFLITLFNAGVDYNLLSKDLCLKYESDGLLVFKNDPMEMLVFNKDGSEAAMCGNGIRCLVHFLYDKFGIYNYLEIKTKSKVYDCQIITKDPFVSSVRLGLGEYIENIFKRTIIIKEKEFIVTAFLLGVPHVMVLSTDFKEDTNYLNEIFEHELFNKEFNISLVNALSADVFEIITFERGVGLTKACGTAAAACGYILHTEYELNPNLIAISPGGILKIDIEDEIVLKGESNFIFRVEE